MRCDLLDNQSLLDEIDYNILKLLQADATMPNAQLAGKVGLSPSACLTRVKRLRERGIIKLFTAIADEQQLGLGVATFTFVSLSRHSRAAAETFVKKIREIPQVMECYNITGSSDYLLKILSPDMSSYRDFVIDTLLEIPGVGHAETLVVLKTEKREFNLPLGDANARRAK
ncbi:MAG: Lrp/AsnC family transcriptional regulator [Armatimonadetes bacterium]|nr:Lrp/AsnC family transcriptional regulator [Armatimonadota bacterium]